MASTSRVRRSMTLEEFLKLPEQKPGLEYIDGRVRAKVIPQLWHSLLTLRFVEELNDFAEPDGLGQAFPELRCTFAGWSIVPDVAYLRQEHIDVDDRGCYVDETLIPPDIYVEILSPEQSPRKSQEKLAHSTAHGCPLGWLIDPHRRVIDVYRAGLAPERLPGDGVLDGAPVLPGFQLTVSEVFGWLYLRGPRSSSPGAETA